MRAGICLKHPNAKKKMLPVCRVGQVATFSEGCRVLGRVEEKVKILKKQEYDAANLSKTIKSSSTFSVEKW